MKLMALCCLLIILMLAGSTDAVDECSGYSCPGNPFECCSDGNCTWWAYCKRPDLYPACNGNGAEWFGEADANDVPVGTEPCVGAIACFWGAGWPAEGHVAYVEEVFQDDSFRVTEMGCGSWNGVRETTYQVADVNGFIYGGPAGDGPTYHATWSSQTPSYPPGLDYYPVAPGQIVDVSFTFNNDGTAYWTNVESSPHYVELQSVTGPGSAEPWSDGLPSELSYNWIDENWIGIVSTAGNVDPDGQGLYSFQIDAPEEPGDYYLYVALYRPHSGEHFSGEGPTLKIRVSPTSLGLAAYWNFNAGDATDNSGNGNDGVVNGATPLDGVSGLALDFDGVNDYINFGNSSSLNPPNALSLAAWYRPESFQGTGNDPIFDKGYAVHESPYYQYHLGVTGDQYTLPTSQGRFGFSVSTTQSEASVATPSHFWTPGNWYFVVGTYDGSAIKLFVNGEFIDMTPLSGLMPNYGKNLNIGRYSGNFHGYLPGTIDEVRLYSRALSLDEIARLYTMEEPGLVANAIDELTDQFEVVVSESGRVDHGRSDFKQVIIEYFSSLYRVVLNWPGSELRLTVYRPDGNTFGEWQSTVPPLIVEFVPDTTGEWTFEITPIDIPYDDYPYALVIGSLLSYVCGDADASAIVNISDAVFLINYIFAGGPAPTPLLAGDADCSGIANISDAVYLINFIFAGGPQPCAAC